MVDAAYKKGPLAWMAENSVAANLLMALVVISGLIMMLRVKQEVFPEFDLDIIVINVAYPGASPEEIEQGILLGIEDGIKGIDGIKEVRSFGYESVGVVSIDLLLGTDRNRILSDVKNAVDRITSFPEDIERPVVSLAQIRNQVMSLVVAGDVSEKVLRGLAEEIRDELLQNPKITLAELAAVRPYEVSVEVSKENLRAYGLSLEEIAARVRRASVEITGGTVKSESGEVLLRTDERRLSADEYGAVALRSLPGGSKLELKDISTIKDGFAENDQRSTFNGKSAAMIKIFRVGDQTPIEIAALVKTYMADKMEKLPEGIELAIWGDRSKMYEERVDLLMRNAYLGLLLVILVVGLFLEVRLAFWITLGIPICFIGALNLLPGFGVSINMISLFGFIVTLGIVVDDAIIVGEAIYRRREEGLGRLDAAIMGVKDVAQPVVFAVLTTIVAFMPMLFVPGISGKFFKNIPVVVIAVLILSLIESLLILPAHLAHTRKGKGSVLIERLNQVQAKFSARLHIFIMGPFTNWVRWSTSNIFLTIALGLMLFFVALGIVSGGWIKFTFLPKIESDQVVATLTMPFGTPVEETRALEKRMNVALDKALSEFGSKKESTLGIFSESGSKGNARPGGGPHGRRDRAGSHLAQVGVYLVASDKRDFSAREFATRWREEVGEIAGAENLNFRFAIGAGSGEAIDFVLSHRDDALLERAAQQLGEHLATYDGVLDIDDGFAAGKEQLSFKLKPQAIEAGLNEIQLARQIRSAFFGVEAQRQLRGREEIRTYVRLPRHQRESEYHLEELMLNTVKGEIPLREAAEVKRGRSYTNIHRQDGRRVIHVTADVDAKKVESNKVVRSVRADFIGQLKSDNPGLSVSLGGEQRRQHMSMGAIAKNYMVALIAMFALLAVAFRSYTQPFLIMLAIPFGFVGMVFGHIVMGYGLSFISMMGFVALSGVVVNDSLVLIVAINRFRDAGKTAVEAALAGVQRRFRAIMLTSLTTFFGLLPMIFEPSVQARFLIPMAISLGFGIMFATLITLFIVPAFYLLLEKIRERVGVVQDPVGELQRL
jgi:multidrug efflux pump subunit AcrB